MTTVKKTAAPAAKTAAPAAKTAAPAPASAPTPVAATKAAPAPAPPKSVPVVEPEVEETDTVSTKFVSLTDKLTTMAATIKDMQNVVKLLQKEYAKAVKSNKKNRATKSATKRSPSGFAKPTGLSDELCDFLGLPHNTQKARTEVTRMLNEYIKKNFLQDAKDKRQITPDDAMKKLMRLKESDKLTYFNLQTYIKHHFIKAA